MQDFVFNHVTLAELPGIARKILHFYPEERIFAFYGDLGAGKTTMIKELCRLLGVTQQVTSPSFAIVNEYDAGGIDLIYHFDFYRIKKLTEVLDIGYEEYLYSGNYCFLEWADKIEDLLPDQYLSITISVTGLNDGREIKTEIIHSPR